MKLRELNNEYFELYGDLYQARALLSDKQYKLTSEALLTAYKEDLEVCVQEKALAVGKERFELRFKVRNWLPCRRFVVFWNRMARKLLKKYLAEFQAELERLDKEQSAASKAQERENSNLPVPCQTALTTQETLAAKSPEGEIEP